VQVIRVGEQTWQQWLALGATVVSAMAAALAAFSWEAIQELAAAENALIDKTRRPGGAGAGAIRPALVPRRTAKTTGNVVGPTTQDHYVGVWFRLMRDTRLRLMG